MLMMQGEQDISVAMVDFLFMDERCRGTETATNASRLRPPDPLPQP